MLKKSSKKHILTLGMWSFPFGTAAVQKLMYMARAVTIDGHDFTVASHKFVRKNDLTKNLQQSGQIYGIKYFTTSPYVFSPNGMHKKIYAMLIGLIREFFWVLKSRRDIDRVILYSYNFIYILIWSKILRIYGIPRYLVYFELRSSVSHRKKLFNRLNDKLLDSNSFSLTNGVFTISELLSDQVQKHSKNTPCFKIPPLVDFDAYDQVALTPQSSRYFLFCGALAYSDVVDFIIDSFRIILDQTDANLHLIINGRDEILKQYKSLSATPDLKGRVKIFSGLTNQDLVESYLNAFALLIPLRKTSQDSARFPQKIAEYCASKRPFITTGVGEILNYFDDESAYISSTFNKHSFSNEMLRAISNEELANKIGEKSYTIGRQFFDYKAYTQPILEFMHFDTSE